MSPWLGCQGNLSASQSIALATQALLWRPWRGLGVLPEVNNRASPCRSIIYKISHLMQLASIIVPLTGYPLKLYFQIVFSLFFPCQPHIFPVPIYVICDYYIHQTDLADLSSFKKNLEIWRSLALVSNISIGKYVRGFREYVGHSVQYVGHVPMSVW